MPKPSDPHEVVEVPDIDVKFWTHLMEMAFKSTRENPKSVRELDHIKFFMEIGFELVDLPKSGYRMESVDKAKNQDLLGPQRVREGIRETLEEITPHIAYVIFENQLYAHYVKKELTEEEVMSAARKALTPKSYDQEEIA